MSGFSASWLALREPADHRARHVGLKASLLTALSKNVQPGQVLRVTDLGCGTGSNLRALSEGLHPRQSWRLVDYDPALLSEARVQLIKWADCHDEAGGLLRLIKNGLEIEVAFERHDLNRSLEHVLGLPADLVTAAAFFDLVSEQWIERFCRALNTVFYTVLTYDGIEEWRPAHPADDMMREAFHAHQGTDKGFGVAAGPRATDVMERCLAATGFQVQRAPSPWTLSRPADHELMSALAEGSAHAVSETGQVSEPDIRSWLMARQQAQTCVVGHEDLLACRSDA